MKKIIACSFILASGLTSLNAFAEWTIPGTHCGLMSPEYITSEDSAYYRDINSIANTKIRASENTPTNMHVRCASPIYTDYGSELDLDIHVHNQSKDSFLSCNGYSLDADGNVVQETVSIGVNYTANPVTMSTDQLRRRSNAKPVTIAVECWIPDRGIKSCGQYACGSKYGISEIFSIRVY